MSSRVDMAVSSTHLLKNSMSSWQFSSTWEKTCLRNSSARSARQSSSQKATSGSTIQNSARWREVLEFSERKVGPKV